MPLLDPHGRAMFSDAALAAFRQFVKIDNATVAQRPQGAQDAMTPGLRKALAKSGVTPKQLGKALQNVGRAYDEMVGAPDPEVVAAILEALKESLPDAGVVAVMKALDDKWPGCAGKMAEPGEHADDDFNPEDEDETDLDLPAANPNANQNDFGKGTEGFDKPARDNPPPFPGMPKPGGKMVSMKKEMASDAAMNDYFRMFPDAARIKLNNYGLETSPTYFTPQVTRPAHAKANRRGFAMDSAEHTAANGAESDYEKMFGVGSSTIVEV